MQRKTLNRFSTDFLIPGSTEQVETLKMCMHTQFAEFLGWKFSEIFERKKTR